MSHTPHANLTRWSQSTAACNRILTLLPQQLAQNKPRVQRKLNRPNDTEDGWAGRRQKPEVTTSAARTIQPTSPNFATH